MSKSGFSGATFSQILCNPYQAMMASMEPSVSEYLGSANNPRVRIAWIWTAAKNTVRPAKAAGSRDRNGFVKP